MDSKTLFLAVLFIGIYLAIYGREISSFFDHTAWKPLSNPKIDATIVDISTEKVKYIKNGSKFKTTITFSDGFQFITHKANVTSGLLSYTVSIDGDKRKELIEKAIAAHSQAVNNPSKAVKQYMEEGAKREKELLEKAQIRLREDLEREKMKQLEAGKREEARQQIRRNTNENERISAFLAEAETYDRVRDISALWENVRMEDNALTRDIGKTIEFAAKIEQMYGVDPGNARKLSADLRKLVEGKVR